MLRAAAGEDALQAARRLVLAGEYEEGARVLRGLLEATPADADALELLGEAMLKRRRWQDGGGRPGWRCCWSWRTRCLWGLHLRCCGRH